MNQPERSLMAAFTVGQRELARLLGNSIEETGLSALDAVALRAVTLNPSVTVGAIGGLLAVRASTASYIVDRLVDRQYAVRDWSDIDGRIALVRLTAVGAQAAKIVDAGIRELDREILSLAGTNAQPVDRVVDAIELLAWRDRRRRLRQW